MYTGVFLLVLSGLLAFLSGRQVHKSGPGPFVAMFFLFIVAVFLSAFGADVLAQHFKIEQNIPVTMSGILIVFAVPMASYFVASRPKTRKK